MNWHTIGYQGARLTTSIAFGIIEFATVYLIAGLPFWPCLASGFVTAFGFWMITP